MKKPADLTLYVPLVLSGVALLAFGFFAVRGGAAVQDSPPAISFTWEPQDGAVDIRDFVGKLSIKDDHGLDFTTYRMTIAENGKTIDLPIPGLVGREYEQDIYLSLLAEDPKLRAAGKATLTFSIKDDHGQEATLTKAVPLTF